MPQKPNWGIKKNPKGETQIIQTNLLQMVRHLPHDAAFPAANPKVLP